MCENEYQILYHDNSVSNWWTREKLSAEMRDWYDNRTSKDPKHIEGLYLMLNGHLVPIRLEIIEDAYGTITAFFWLAGVVVDSLKWASGDQTNTATEGSSATHMIKL